jgi:hypothetical protein
MMGDFVVRREQRFRKRPLVVDAIRWQGDTTAFARWEHELGALPFDYDEFSGRYRLRVRTLSGKQIEVVDGEWVIRGTKGEFYPCDPEVFEETYERVTVELVPTPEAISAFFSEEYADMTGREFWAKFPLVERVVERTS